jgi:hypothetical protein
MVDEKQKQSSFHQTASSKETDKECSMFESSLLI